MAWYKSLPNESITSWKGLGRLSSRNFTTSRRHPKSEVSLEAIIQGKDESLGAYIERFNKEVVQVSTTADMKKYLLEQGLRPRSDFAKTESIETPANLDAFFLKALAYIQYKENEAAHTSRDSKNKENTKSARQEEGSRRGANKKREDKTRDAQDYKGPPGKFRDYTPLSASREHILTECVNSKFKTIEVCFPKQLPAQPSREKSKFYRFHKSHGHNTEDCIHLKDAIKILIKEVSQAVRQEDGSSPRNKDLGRGETLFRRRRCSLGFPECYAHA
ncbi:uncharacterized protein LOC131604992 [Vicia villosa]|uniref:uncharacterized protein LOC131604992 n=1 Tax=Vicia villosa TaxID=3911 RepID=UPI00273C8CB1|nr:uncharacterized protein LOC131604992 [Vicia villosa]